MVIKPNQGDFFFNLRKSIYMYMYVFVYSLYVGIFWAFNFLYYIVFYKDNSENSNW